MADISKNERPIGRCKGTLLVNLRSFVASKGAERAWSDLVASVSPADASILRQPLLVGSWYAVGVWNRALRVYLATSTNPSEEMKRYAKYVAERDLNTVMKFILSIATPEIIVARTSMFWSRYFDVCTLTPTKVGPQRWVLAISGPTGDDEAPAVATCTDGVPGWVEQALMLSGAKSPRVTQTQCRFRGATECRCEVVW